MSTWRDFFRRRRDVSSEIEVLKLKLEKFRDLLEINNRVLELMADLEEKQSGEYVFDIQYLRSAAEQFETSMRAVVFELNVIAQNRYTELAEAVERASASVRAVLESKIIVPKASYVVELAEVDRTSSSVVGEKMATLGEIRNRLGLAVPEGFVVSTHACQLFLERCGIMLSQDGSAATASADLSASLQEQSENLRDRVLRTRAPRKVGRAIRRALSRLQKRTRWDRFAVRSSAAGEDGEFSFAGQYETALGVVASDVEAAYRQVVASLYSPNVMTYRQSRGLQPTTGVMAVGCLSMVRAHASGVLYTLDPTGPGKDVLLVTAAFGLGKGIVDGSMEADRFQVDRDPPHQVVSQSIGRKQWRYGLAVQGGIEKSPVPEQLQRGPCVTAGQLAKLAQAALRIEKYMRCALDIEWAIGEDGILYVLQARPLRLDADVHPQPPGTLEAVRHHQTLMRNRGSVACRGIGAGPVHIVRSDSQIKDFPPGAVLVARTTSPRLSAAVSVASAVVTDIGTATGHLATIAREYHVPTLVDTGDATQVLRDGMEVTVDAEENVVYEGRVKELLRYQLLQSSSYQDKTEFRLLRAMLRVVAPLNLKDPQAANFSPRHCRTYHDVVRFAHEKAVEELTRGHDLMPSRRSAHVKELELAIPLDLILVDIGGGISDSVGERDPAVMPGQVACRPLGAILEGLTAKGVWVTEPADMDIRGFMSSATRSGDIFNPAEYRATRNVAVVSSRYMNLSLKLGYHFNIIDVYLSQERNDNYIYFRFVGGVTELARRTRRAGLLRRILEHHDFVVEGRLDLVIARIKKIPYQAMVDRLTMIGRLVGFTRQLDILLRDESSVEHYAQSFLDGCNEPLDPTEGKVTTASSRDMEVLVLDDEPIVCQRLKEHLEKKGFSVETFTESQPALDRLAAKSFDVVVTDFKMKGPTGLDVLHFVRSNSPSTQVIMITGYASYETAREAEVVGIYDYIAKPFKLEAISAKVKKAAKRARKLRRSKKA